MKGIDHRDGIGTRSSRCQSPAERDGERIAQHGATPQSSGMLGGRVVERSEPLQGRHKRRVHSPFDRMLACRCCYAYQRNMIAEVFPEAYDAQGRKALRPDLRRKGLRSTAPMRRYVSQPLTVECKSLSDLRNFLCTCKYVSDQEQFGTKDYWQPPDEFERTRMGDCDCFALWTWRELLALGFEARFVTGRAGRYGQGHAWVQYAENGRTFIVEPTAARLGMSIPRLSTFRYRPRFSVAWDGENLTFYSHEARTSVPPLSTLIAAVPEWTVYWSWAWSRTIALLPRALYRRIRRSEATVSAARREP